MEANKHMFQSTLELQEPGKDAHAHILDLFWKDFKPTLTYLDLRDDEVKELDLDEALQNGIVIMDATQCIGRLEDDSYTPCPTKEKVDRFSQCQECASIWIPKLTCLFEPSCEFCHAEFCERPHVVYITFFGAKPKVGMTGADRVLTRAQEQGADAVMVLDTVPHRKDARALEKEVSKTLRVPQFYSKQTLLKLVTSSVDKRAIEVKAEDLSNGLQNVFDITPGEITYLDDYQLTFPLRSTPFLRKTVGGHKGKVIGSKGRFLFYESEGINALNLQDLPSRFMRFG